MRSSAFRHAHECSRNHRTSGKGRLASCGHAVTWWSENRSEEQALRWYDGIRDAIETLANHPQRCVLARENPKSGDEIRELHFGLGSRPTHRVIFVIDPDAVRVLAVRHAAQDDWNAGRE